MLDVRLQTCVDCRNYPFPGFLFLNVAIDSVLNENALQRSKMPLFFQFFQLDFKFLLQQFHSSVRASSKHFGNTNKKRFVVLNHAAQWRNGSLATRESIQ